MLQAMVPGTEVLQGGRFFGPVYYQRSILREGPPENPDLAVRNLVSNARDFNVAGLDLRSSSAQTVTKK